ncbi:MAG: hypothetical protein KAS69_06450 [Planctomycetes bacterium]|nr:hypothetical protein [Planctomycetota bacterium]
MKIQFHIGRSPQKKAAANRSGFILGLVIIMLVVISILGVGLLSQSGTDMMETAKATKSTQAFWIAEAGLNMAISYLPVMPPTNPLTGTLGSGDYSVTITPVSAYRWTVESTGTAANTTTRNVRVTVGANATTVMMTSGELRIQGAADVNGVYEDNTTPNFEEVFGVTKTEMRDYATYDYTNPPHNETPVEQITWIDDNNQFKITKTGNWVGSGIMVINGDLDMAGGVFDGVIWVIGELFISGNIEVNGSIFVEGDITVDTRVTGTANINFDQAAIDAAFGNLLTFPDPPEPTVLSWSEF